MITTTAVFSDNMNIRILHRSDYNQKKAKEVA